jgi:hypothetical protein
MHRFSRHLLAMLTSERFFYAIVILFVFQALWFACSAIYPMAFDENFHFGLIKIYATQWSPFFTSVPAGSGEFGAFTRDNSYLYHYLMSFPYRLIKIFFSSQESQIILLRVINIGFFVGGLALFRQLLFKTAASRALVHFSLLALILIPVVPMLAAHINYDNLIFLLLPLILLLTLRCTEAIRQSHALPIQSACSLVIICLLTSIVKYAFLPIFLAIFIYLIITIFRLPRTQRFLFLRRLWPDFRKLSTKLHVIFFSLLALSGGLFIERYGVNLVQYQSLVPECSKVVSIAHCSHYGPWVRNYAMKAQLVEKPVPNFLLFNLDWFNGMLFRLFFAINTDYDTKGPLPLPITAAYLVALPGIFLVAIFMRRLIENRIILLFLLIIIIYSLSIYGNNFQSYLALGELTAVNGRYFIPLLPLIFTVVGLSFSFWLRSHKNATYIKTSMIALALLLFSQGGGLMTFLIRSDTQWYWQSQPIISLNEAARVIVNHIVLFK